MAEIRRRKRRRWDVLTDLVRRHGLKVGAELGVLEGQTHLHLLSTCPELTLVGVDLWEPQPEKDEESDAGGRSYLDHDLVDYERRVRLAALAFEYRSVLLKMDTVAASHQFADFSFDFVFIDADHTYEGVMRDIEAWTPKIRPGGFITGHDYQDATAGVQQAVNEKFEVFDIEEDVVWIAQV
jgi:predicted O-methyltransferase YrrM|tara:strand:- start:121 stop:666 length:546 start_codon:yes stop_codon:yes gene_type:complete